MLVECPSCSTQYDLPDDQLKGGGRQVRCVRCGHVWFLAVQPVEEPAATEADPDISATMEAADAAMAEALSGAEDDETADTAEDTPADVAPELPTEADDDGDDDEGEDPWERRRRRNAAMAADLPETFNRRPDLPHVEDAPKGRGKVAAAWLLFALLVAGSAYGAHAYKDTIVEAIPQTKSVYEAAGYSFSGPLDGLALIDIKSDRSLENGSSVLVVEGKITNASDENKRIPELRAELLDANQNTITEWTFTLDIGFVVAGNETAFREVIIDPDPTAVDIQLSFVTADPNS